VSDATRRRVQEAVTQLGYRPNAAARNLVQRRTNLIGVVVGDLANAFDAELVKSIEQHASGRRYTTLVSNTGGRAELETPRIEALLEQRVDGIALLDFSGDRAVLSELMAERVPVVMVSCWADYADCVAVDDFAGIELAIEHLAGLGHRRIGYALDPLMEASTRRARQQAFERAMLRRSLDLRPEWTIEAAGIGALVEADERPTAMTAANDYTAIRVMDGLETAGLTVPGDVSIVGFDGIALGALGRIALTTVAQPGDALAAGAVELLLDRIERGHDAPPVQQRLSPSLVVRRSTAPPRE
jgi:LacI family transcriptional regulator